MDKRRQRALKFASVVLGQSLKDTTEILAKVETRHLGKVTKRMGLDVFGYKKVSSSRASGAVIAVSRNEDDGEEWRTDCLTHGFLVESTTRALAEAAASFPDWCEECQSIINDKEGSHGDDQGHLHQM